jgi:hypothetical protein
MTTDRCVSCGAGVALPWRDAGRDLMPATMVFYAPPRCGACLKREKVERDAREREGARAFYREHILDKAPAVHRAALEACEDVLLDAILQAWRDAE